MKKNFRSFGLYMSILLIILLAVVLGSKDLSKTSQESLSYTQLYEKIESKEVKTLTIQSPVSGEVAEVKVVLQGDPAGAQERIAAVHEDAFKWPTNRGNSCYGCYHSRGATTKYLYDFTANTYDCRTTHICANVFHATNARRRRRRQGYVLR